MNSIVAIVLASCLMMSAVSGQALDLSCSGVCNLNCNIINTTCRLIPGLTALCDTLQGTCTTTCSTTCSCLDGCQARCAGDFADCVQGGNPIVDGTLCLATQALCGAFCFPSCGVKLSQGALTQVISALG